MQGSRVQISSDRPLLKIGYDLFVYTVIRKQIFPPPSGDLISHTPYHKLPELEPKVSITKPCWPTNAGRRRVYTDTVRGAMAGGMVGGCKQRLPNPGSESALRIFVDMSQHKQKNVSYFLKKRSLVLQLVLRPHRIF